MTKSVADRSGGRPPFRPGPGTSAEAAAERVRALGRAPARAPGGWLPRAVERVHERVRGHRDWIEPLRAALQASVIGREHLLNRLLVALVAGRPLLVQGGPGLSKSLSLRALATATGLEHRGIRLDPESTRQDLILPGEGHHLGPLFANLLLVEDLDDAPRRVQDALLEAAWSGRLAPDSERLDLPTPFLLVATERPDCRPGAWPLRDAVLDRFFLRVELDYPSARDERAILDRAAAEATPIVDPSRLREARVLVEQIHLDERIKDYIVSLVHATREPAHYGLGLADALDHGVSPRATRDLERASQAVAFLRGGAYVRTSDVEAIWADVVGHRLGLSPAAVAAERTGRDIAAAILAGVPAP